MAIFKENLTSKILQEISSKIVNKSKRNLYFKDGIIYFYLM
jgi:hypothetical protein